MLILISDLHFVDGTAGEHNILTKTFDEIFHELSANAKSVNAKEVKLVFLGDTFDILRTERWFEVPINNRPWGVNTKEDKVKMEAHANSILDSIINHPENINTFKILSGSLKERYDFPVEPERFFVIGNHDRLCAEFNSIFERCKKLINASNTKPIHNYLNSDYGIFGRHGHEFDGFNYEGTSKYTDEDYLKIPIGDVITTELIARMPYTIMKHKKIQELAPPDKEKLKRNLQEIESVRPLSATIDWLFYEVSNNDWLLEIIDDCIKNVVKDFRKIPFVKKWIKQHHKLFHLLDDANIIRIALAALSTFNLKQIDKILDLTDVITVKYKDPLIQASADDFARLGTDIYYVSYGHTHLPLQIPIKVENINKSNQRELIYVNTGTWVDKYQGAREKGYINWNHITYTLFYNIEEAKYTDVDNVDYPIFETWTGALKKQKG